MTTYHFDKLRNKLKREGALAFSASALRLIFPVKAASFQLCQDLVNNRSGLEIGGPSSVFQRRGIMPLYRVVRSLDNCNFSHETVWEGKIQAGKTFKFHEKREPGHQFVGEATKLQMIPSGKYDFVLSSHVLEHTANPIAALTEWLRVLKSDGVLVILVPHKDGTFDCRRPVTSLQHLKEDFDCLMPETDQSHMQEILAMHQLSRDPEAGTLDNFRQRCSQNFANRCAHHHVFDTSLLVELLDHMGVKLLAIEAVKPYHILAIARKCSPDLDTDNCAFTSGTRSHLVSSPFPTDRMAAKKMTGTSK